MLTPETHAICLSCWRKRWPARAPVQACEREYEKCCDCGDETKDGIYIQMARDRVRHPSYHPDFDDSWTT